MSTSPSVPEQEALLVTVRAPVVSFRNPLYSGVQVTLPCPAPSTVGGMLAAAAGGWQNVTPGLSFAMAFHARGAGTDLETYHPLDAQSKATSPNPRNREFLAAATLRIWLFDDIDTWYRRIRRPRWPLRLGRSQDLVGVEPRRETVRAEPGEMRSALVPHSAELDAGAGRQLRLAEAMAPGHVATRWGSYRFDETGRASASVAGSWSTADGEAVVRLPSPHPATVAGGPGTASTTRDATSRTGGAAQ